MVATSALLFGCLLFDNYISLEDCHHLSGVVKQSLGSIVRQSLLDMQTLKAKPKK